MRPSIWLKPTLVPFSLAFSSHSRFCVNDYIAKMYTKIACNISSGRFDVRLQVMQPFLNFSCFFLTHKVPLIEEFPIIEFYLYHVTSAGESSNWTTSGIKQVDLTL